MSKMSTDAPDDAAAPGNVILTGPTMGTTWRAELGLPAGSETSAIERDLAQAVELVDAQMSTWRPGSDLMQLSRAAPGVWVKVPAQLYQVIELGLAIGEASDGLFDICLGDLVSAWGFGPAAPDESAITAMLGQGRQSAGHLLEMSPATQSVRTTAPAKLDLCGIAKGYALDLMAAVLDRYGVDNWMVTLDGDLRAQGRRSVQQGWMAALEAPFREARQVHGFIEISDAAVATSGDYRNWIALDDRVLSHTMDRRAGMPCLHDLASVTVIAPTGAQADAWATALLVAGPQSGPALAEREGIHAIFLRRGDDGRVSELEVGAAGSL